MTANTMKAIRFHDYGGPEVLVLDEVERPQPQSGQVLVRVRTAGVNPADWKMRAGMFKAFGPMPLPSTPGLEGAGTVEALGADVTGFKPGDEVFGILIGAYAEYALAAAEGLQHRPKGLSPEQAASVPVGALTAWAAIESADIQSGQRVLVHGAAGGVGNYVVQLARLKGAHVIGTASAANQELVRSLGAEALDYQATPFETVLHDLDAVIDTVGGELAARSFKVLRPDGIYVTVAGRPTPEAGKAEGVRAMSAGRAPAENLGKISELLASGELKPLAGTVFPLADAAKAQELSQSGHGSGRILLHISG